MGKSKPKRWRPKPIKSLGKPPKLQKQRDRMASPDQIDAFMETAIAILVGKAVLKLINFSALVQKAEESGHTPKKAEDQ